MHTNRFVLIASLACLLAGCGQRTPWVRLSADSKSFVLSPGNKPFTPWGFNYDRDYKMRLLEEYWQSEWPTVAEDFREMKQLGANVARIHLQVSRFMDTPHTLRDDSLKQLDRLLSLAEQTGIYLDITGLACYRKQDVPAWYNDLSEPDRWAVQTRFWEAIAKRCANSPAVFCYDLMNEPVVPGGRRKPGDWLAGELAGFSYVQCISLDQANRPRPEIARQWVSTLVSAIRRYDRHHLITVGLLPNSHDGPGFTSGFLPQLIAADLDFISVHIYPNAAQLDADLATLKRFATSKPLVIEETFPLGCSPKQLRQFIIDTRTLVAGHISFYWGQTPAELRSANKLPEALIAEWLEEFHSACP